MFHILSDFISPINKAKLENLSQTLNIEIKTYLLDNNIFTSYIPWGEGHNFTTYYRLKIASFLPQHIEKCIYLDSDMIVNHNILELYRTDLQGKMCGVVGDERISDQTMVVLDENNNYKINTKYSFNAGLLLLNLKKWREQNIESKLFNLLKNVRLTDQDALNVVFDDDILLLDSRWNCFPALIENSPKKAWHHIFSDEANDEIKATTKSTKEQYTNICKEAKIIHFGGPKPWQIKMYTFPNSYIFQTNHYYFRLWWVNSVHSNFYSDIRNSFLKSFLKTIYVKIKKPEQIFRTHIIKPIKNLRKKG
ncbi:MAG: glycosyltransferase family 8 protein [Helicobacteraceae bacterium]|nr:glycosyltransferase family 8 protein [Helicobacteraceae bacterium]